MAKSQIIKDLANGDVDIITALKRTKILLNCLNDTSLLEWVNNEIGGYPEGAEVPSYRVIYGQLYGSYMKGSLASHIRYTKVPLPIGEMPEDVQERLLKKNLRTSISTLQNMIENDTEGREFLMQIPADLYPYIARWNNDLYMIISSAYVKLDMVKVRNIFPQVENILLDILTYLEKNFGILDDLDIDINDKSDEELSEIIKYLNIVINNNVSVGDNNKIVDSVIASSIEEKE